VTDADLQKLFELAENITRHRGFPGHRDTEDLKRNSAEFVKLRRIVVHQLAKREGTFGLHKAQLEAALWKVANEGDVPDVAYDYTREQLLDHLAKEHQRSPASRLLVRWGPPVFGLGVSTIFFAIHFWRDLEWLLS
jgi:hypothetical protein